MAGPSGSAAESRLATTEGQTAQPDAIITTACRMPTFAVICVAASCSMTPPNATTLAQASVYLVSGLQLSIGGTSGWETRTAPCEAEARGCALVHAQYCQRQHAHH